MKAGKEVFDMQLDFKELEKCKGYPSYQVLQQLSFVPVKSDVTRYYKQLVSFTFRSTSSSKIRRDESWRTAMVLSQHNIFDLYVLMKQLVDKSYIWSVGSTCKT